MEEGIQNSGDRSQKGRRWSRRLKNCFIAVSAFLCVGAMVAWGISIAGWNYEAGLTYNRTTSYSVWSQRGGIVLRYFYNSLKVPPRLYPPEGWKFFGYGGVSRIRSEEEPLFVPLKLLDEENLLSNDFKWNLLIPYWLLILLFAITPMLWLLRRYIERRDKRLFEQIKREKLASEGGGGAET